MSLIVYGATDTGRVRDHNEDSILALEMNRTCVGVDALLVVADGMGGHAAGEIASGITISDIDECFRTGVFSNKSADEIESSLSTLLQEMVPHAHSELPRLIGLLSRQLNFSNRLEEFLNVANCQKEKVIIHYQ